MAKRERKNVNIGSVLSHMDNVQMLLCLSDCIVEVAISTTLQSTLLLVFLFQCDHKFLSKKPPNGENVNVVKLA